MISICMMQLKITSVFLIRYNISFSQTFVRTGKNIGVSGGISKNFELDQTNIHFGIHSHVSKHFIPEITYRNSTQYQIRRIENFGENQHFITPGVQLRVRFLSTPGRRVRGICTKEFFDASGDLIHQHKALTIDEIEENKDYALVISTNSGLWRYILGDLVRLVDRKELRIIISGRIKQTLNLCGEHLTLDNLNQSVKEVCENVNLPHSDYTIISNQEEQVHQWYMEEQDGIDENKLIELIDRKICSLNDDYAYVRKHALNHPTLTYLPKGSFYGFMKSLNKLGAQNKMPRVLNRQQAEQWVKFVDSLKRN
jgi:hypothetical protein